MSTSFVMGGEDVLTLRLEEQGGARELFVDTSKFPKEERRAPLTTVEVPVVVCQVLCAEMHDKLKEMSRPDSVSDG